MKTGKILGITVFILLWLALYVAALALMVLPVANAAVRLNSFLLISAIVLPAGIPSAFIGRAIGHALQSKGYLRSLWLQLLSGISWSAIAAVWMFLVVLVAPSIAGSGANPPLLQSFMGGFLFVTTLISVILVPSTVFASAILAFVLRNSIPSPSGAV